VTVRIGGFVVTGLTGVVIDTWKLPWDCEVIGVDLDYITTGQHLDAVTLKTVDATALTLVTIGDLSANVPATAQTLHSDIIGVRLVKGNKIQLIADSTDGTEKGYLFVDLHLRPSAG
jgi:hypothetical protein